MEATIARSQAIDYAASTIDKPKNPIEDYIITMARRDYAKARLEEAKKRRTQAEASLEESLAEYDEANICKDTVGNLLKGVIGDVANATTTATTAARDAADAVSRAANAAVDAAAYAVNAAHAADSAAAAIPSSFNVVQRTDDFRGQANAALSLAQLTVETCRQTKAGGS